MTDISGTMVERATLAFMRALPDDFYIDERDGEHGRWWEHFTIDGSGDVRPAIRAALATLREPTEATPIMTGMVPRVARAIEGCEVCSDRGRTFVISLLREDDIRSIARAAIAAMRGAVR